MCDGPQPAFYRPGASLWLASGGRRIWVLSPWDHSHQNIHAKKTHGLNDISNGPILKGFVTILLF